MRTPTLWQIEKVVSEMFFGGKKEVPNPKSLVIDGYAYRVTVPKSEETKSTTVNMGYGGVMMMIDSFQQTGIPDFIILNSIEVFIEDNWVKLSNIIQLKNNIAR